MRVLFHVDHDLSRPGGIETHVRELALGLAARGHEVEVFGRPAECPPFTMVSRVDPARYDVIHHHDGYWPGQADVGGRYVRTFHLCVAAKMNTYLRLGRIRTLANLENWRVRAEEAASCLRPGRLIAVSERTRLDLARLHGADPTRIVVIPNGVHFAPPREPRETLRRRYGIAAGAFVLLTIGRDDFVKGHGLLARAWDASGVAARGAVWVNVGGAARAQHPGKVATGPVDHAEAMSWVHAADLGAFPSYYEGCGTGLLEMLAGDLFTLTHAVGIAPEVIRDGANGRILEPAVGVWAEAIAAEIMRPRPRSTRALAPEFAWDVVAARVEEVYREAIARAVR